MARSVIESMHSEYGRLIDETIDSWLQAQPERPDGFYAMMRYQLGLVHDDLSPVVARGEKRLCSLLCLLTCQAVSGSCRDAVHAAAAIELLSNWFRVHIDLEVHEPVERGRVALWERWGDAQAINAGDGLFPLAGRYMLEATGDPVTSLDLARELAEIAVVLMEGQHLELSCDGRKELTAQECLQVIRLKIGELTGYSAWAGAVVGEAGEETRTELRRFGLELGTARQILDEIAGTQPELGHRRRRIPCTQLTEALARRHFDCAIAALGQARLEAPGYQNLEAFARDLVPL